MKEFKEILENLVKELEDLEDDYPRDRYFLGYNAGLIQSIDQIKQKINLIEKLIGDENN